jgi:hypothetical protein
MRPGRTLGPKPTHCELFNIVVMRASHPQTIEEGNAIPPFSVSMEGTGYSSPETVIPSFGDGESTQIPSIEQGTAHATPSVFLPLAHQPSVTASGYYQSIVSSLNNDNPHPSTTLYSQNGVSAGQYDDHARVPHLGSPTQRPTLPQVLSQQNISNDPQINPATYHNRESPLQSTSSWPIRVPPHLPPPDRRHPLSPESSYLFRH